MAIYILYSADYELYLGGNDCDESDVLIRPTDTLLDLFDTSDIPVTLFADTFSIECYRKHSLFSFPDAAEGQLKDAIRRGHDVQSHVHPHWRYTRIDGNRYTVNPNYYLLGKLADNNEELYPKILSYLLTSRMYLNDLLTQVNKNYRCIAFRSGGYGLQPHADVVIKALIDSGFLMDSSIVPDLIANTNTINEVDFSGVPKKANYYLDCDVDHASETNRGIFEIPIASCTFNILETALFQIEILSAFLRNTIHPEKSTVSRGYSIQATLNKPRYSKYYNFLNPFRDRFFYLDCSTNDNKMVRCTKKYLSRFDYRNNDVFFSCNMHPKGLSKEHFDALDRYHTNIKNYYKEIITPISYQQAAEMVVKNPPELP